MEPESACGVSLPGRILVVEDDRQILSIISDLLEDEGYEIQTASDGKQALACLRDGPNPDLIILDLMLPALDGWEFRAIQRADPALSGIPVLAVSADPTPKAAAIDATSFLRKPFGAEVLLGRVRDIIGERVRLGVRMAETERLVALGRLAAEATHELSNPLGSVVANVSSIDQLLRRMTDIVHELPRDPGHPAEAALLDEGRATVSEMQDTLRDLHVGTDRMTHALDELRTSARRRADPFGAVDIRIVLESAIALTAHELRPRARLVTDFPDVPAVRGNELRLSQLFTNLLLNAAHAIDAGNTAANRIFIGIQPGQQTLTVEIRDTGSGMTAEVRARLFEPFFTTKPEGLGSGLGLPICQAIAREHLGRIEVESAPGRGSVVRVTLPLDRVVVEPEPASGRLSRERSPIRVLPQSIRRGWIRQGPGSRRPG
jgi:signal transduction histidine kinase